MRAVRQKESRILIIILITGIVCFVIASYILIHRPNTTAQESPVSDWNTYNNSELGIAFRYPPDWKVIQAVFLYDDSGLSTPWIILQGATSSLSSKEIEVGDIGQCPNRLIASSTDLENLGVCFDGLFLPGTENNDLVSGNQDAENRLATFPQNEQNAVLGIFHTLQDIPVASDTPLNITDASGYPARCTVEQKYSIGAISPAFLEHGYDKESLLVLVQVAAQQWENALGTRLFVYDPNATSNQINFTDDTPSSTTADWGGVTFTNAYPNGTIKNFKIDIFDLILQHADNAAPFFTGLTVQDVEESDIERMLAHELGHAIGFPANHMGLPPIGPAVMSPLDVLPTGRAVQLTDQDISLMKEWCGGSNGN